MNNQRVAEVKTNFMCQTIDKEHISIFGIYELTRNAITGNVLFFSFKGFSNARVDFLSVGSEFTVFNAVGIPTRLSSGRSMLLPQLLTQFLRNAHVSKELRGKTGTKWSRTSSLI